MSLKIYCTLSNAINLKWSNPVQIATGIQPSVQFVGNDSYGTQRFIVVYKKNGGIYSRWGNIDDYLSIFEILNKSDIENFKIFLKKFSGIETILIFN